MFFARLGFAQYNSFNKKVLLRERKRHTARRVANARYAGGGDTPSSHGGGYPIQSWWVGGYHPVMVKGTPSSHGRGYLIQSWWVGGTPGNPPRPGWGTPPPSRYGRGTPLLHHPELAGVPPSTIQTWFGYPPPPRPSRPGWGTPPPVEVWTNKQTENSTFPHPSVAGGKKPYWFL